MIEEVISNDCDISETFNKIFAYIVPNLKIIANEKLVLNVKQKIQQKTR